MNAILIYFDEQKHIVQRIEAAWKYSPFDFESLIKLLEFSICC